MIQFRLFLLSIFATTIFAVPGAMAQFYQQNPHFQLQVATRNGSYISGFIKQPDHKIIVLGGMDFVNGVKKNSPVRLNEDGSLDETFYNIEWGGGMEIALRKDGKLISRNAQTGTDGNLYVQLSLFSSEGYHESSLLTEVKTSHVGSAKALAVQNDHKVIIGTLLPEEDFSANGRAIISRINTDGTIDTGFDTEDLGITWVSSIVIQDDEKILVSGTFEMDNGSFRNIVRLNRNGSLDTSFNPVFNHIDHIYAVELQEDNKILLGMVNELVRLHPNGDRDEEFMNNSYAVRSLALQDDGQILIGSWEKDVENQFAGSGRVIRLKTDGSRDGSFNAGEGAKDHSIDALVVQRDGNILAGGLFPMYNGHISYGAVRLNGNTGSYDPAFSTRFESIGYINDVLLQENGKTLVYGNFNLMNGVGGNDLARLNADGTPDNSFNIGTGVDGYWNVNGGLINAVALQEDQKLIVGGSFKSFNSNSANSLLRLNADGSIDPGFEKFELEGYYVSALAVQKDRKILVGGGGSSDRLLTRLLPDGTVDPDFSPGTGVYGTVESIVIQEDDKILIAGSFNSYNNEDASFILRLNADGSIDDSFQASEIDYAIRKMVLQQDGTILVLGEFIEINHQLVNKIVRLQTDGRLDESFMPDFGNFYQLQDFFLQADGQVLVTGFLFEGQKKIVLLGHDGKENADFKVIDHTLNWYTGLAQAGNKIFVYHGYLLHQLHALHEQTIDFSPVTDKFIGDAAFELVATASSGLPVAFTLVSGPATVEGNIVSLTGEAGTVTIRASQAGNDSFDVAQSVDISFQVLEALGIGDQEFHSVNIYPNPSTGYILVDLPYSTGNFPVIQLYDMKGQKVKASYNATGTGYRMELGHIPRGMYFLLLANGTNRFSRKIILE